MSDEERILSRIISHVGDFLETDVSHLTADSRFDSALQGLDSLQVFEMILYIEECLGIEIDKSRLPEIETIGGLVNLIRLAHHDL